MDGNGSDTWIKVRVKKCDADLMVNATRFPSHVRAYLFEYGVRQKLNDSLASFNSDPKAGSATTRASKVEMLKMVTELLERLYAGETTAKAEPTSPEAIAYKFASTQVFNIWQKKNPSGKPTDYKDRHADTLRFIDENPRIMEMARMQAELAAIAAEAI